MAGLWISSESSSWHRAAPESHSRRRRHIFFYNICTDWVTSWRACLLGAMHFVAWDLCCVDECRLSWVWGYWGADVIHVCSCWRLIACSAALCAHAGAFVHTCHVFMLMLTVGLHFIYLFLFIYFWALIFFFSFPFRCACAKFDSMWPRARRSRCQVYNNTQRTQVSQRLSSEVVISMFERFSWVSFQVLLFALYRNR